MAGWVAGGLASGLLEGVRRLWLEVLAVHFGVVVRVACFWIRVRDRALFWIAELSPFASLLAAGDSRAWWWGGIQAGCIPEASRLLNAAEGQPARECGPQKPHARTTPIVSGWG